MKNPYDISIIYLAQNEKFFTLSLDKNFDINMQIFLDGYNDFVTPLRMMSDSILIIRVAEYIIGSKYKHCNDFPKQIKISGIVNDQSIKKS